RPPGGGPGVPLYEYLSGARHVPVPTGQPSICRRRQWLSIGSAIVWLLLPFSPDPAKHRRFSGAGIQGVGDRCGAVSERGTVVGGVSRRSVWPHRPPDWYRQVASVSA